MTESGVISKTVMVFGQMNEPPGARLRVGLTGLTMAEYFRDEGRDVLLFIDNIFRFTQAGSEVSALLGRMPSAVGYQPTLATEMAGLQERITSTKTGSITSMQAVYVPADDYTDPAPGDHLRPPRLHHPPGALPDRAGHLPGRGPADLDLPRPRPAVVGQEHYDVAREVQRVLQRYRDLQDIIAILGIDELTEEDSSLVGSRAQDPALPQPADVRGRGVHRPTGPLRRDQGHGRVLQGDPGRQGRRPAGAGVLPGGHHRRRARERRQAGQRPDMPLHLEIVTPERQVYTGDVDIVVCPGIEGELGILPHHAPLFTTLGSGSCGSDRRRGGVLRHRRRLPPGATGQGRGDGRDGRHGVGDRPGGRRAGAARR